MSRKRRYMHGRRRRRGKSPLNQDVVMSKDLVDSGKAVAKEVVSNVVKKNAPKVMGLAGRGLSRFIPFLGMATGAYDVFKGYGDLAKTKHGKQIIKDSRMMSGKI